MKSLIPVFACSAFSQDAKGIRPLVHEAAATDSKGVAEQRRSDAATKAADFAAKYEPAAAGVSRCHRTSHLSSEPRAGRHNKFLRKGEGPNTFSALSDVR